MCIVLCVQYIRKVRRDNKKSLQESLGGAATAFLPRSWQHVSQTR